MDRIKISDTYEILLNDGNNGQKVEFRALRYAEEWRDLIGDNLVLAMAYKIQELKKELLNKNNKVIHNDYTKIKKKETPISDNMEYLQSQTSRSDYNHYNGY